MKQEGNKNCTNKTPDMVSSDPSSYFSVLSVTVMSEECSTY